MDALAGYGSDSSHSDAGDGGGGALSGLLGHYSDDSGSEDGNKKEKLDNGTENTAEQEGVVSTTKAVNDDDEADAQPKMKRRRRWDNPNQNYDDIDTTPVNIDSVLPPPPLLPASSSSDGNKNEDGVDSFQSIMLSPKDYTTELRSKLSKQLQKDQSSSQNQGSNIARKQQLSTKLEQLYNKFHHQNNEDSTPSSSFATHLKSQHDFNNPHLFKSIIDHFGISPLESSSSISAKATRFKAFEYVDRLMSSEERARINATSSSGV